MAKEGKEGVPRRRRQSRGVFERPKGSGVWWVRYHDPHGREHRERVGPRVAAEVYGKRKTEIAGAKVALAIHVGLRRGEQFGLRWEHVDFAVSVITVPRSKSREARRVPMNDAARDIL